VTIHQGKLVLENCDIDSTAEGSCVYIHGSTARAVMGQCRIRNGSINVYNSGEVTVENCKIRRGRGISVVGRSKGTIENCEISDTIANISESNLVIRQCQIQAISVLNSGEGTIEDCDIFDNRTGEAISIYGGNSVIRQCRIHDCKVGIYVGNSGEGTIEDCDIFGNEVGVMISSGGNPVIRRSRINRNNLAVYVSNNGKGTIEDCDLTNNNHGAWSIDSTSSVQRSRNIE
jgi:parallel beta-helix repeat protein